MWGMEFTPVAYAVADPETPYNSAGENPFPFALNFFKIIENFGKIFPPTFGEK